MRIRVALHVDWLIYGVIIVFPTIKTPERNGDPQRAKEEILKQEYGQ